MSILTNTLLESINKEFALEEPTWNICGITEKELQFLIEECNNTSEFDPLNSRKTMLEKYLSNQSYTMFSECDYGKVFGIFESINQMAELPLGLWGRILRMYSEKKGGKPFKVYFLAVSNLRLFPEYHKAITPENINGGYTYRCDPETIVIYRAEDATRVLIHELMHSCCLDKPENGVDIMEAETEAWAELIYIGFVSQGKKFIFNDLLKRQSEWMRKQNKKVKRHMKDPESREFPWRYTIGKEDVWRRWGILYMENLKPDIHIGKSLRLTYPPNDMMKERFKVLKTSHML